MIVLDASAAIEWLIKSPTGTKVDRRLFSSSPPTLHVPHLLDVEITQVLRRYVREKTMTTSRGEEALQDLSRPPPQSLPPRHSDAARMGTASGPDGLRRRLCRARGIARRPSPDL